MTQLTATHAGDQLSREQTWHQFQDRLRGYLGLLAEYERQGVVVVSSHQLGRGLKVRASLVRRDLGELGGLGTRGKGYQVKAVAEAIRDRLHLKRERLAVWLGGGGQEDWARISEAMRAANCVLVGVFDEQGGARVTDGVRVQALSRAPAEVRRTGATVAVVASERAARRELLQKVADAGVTAVLNLTPRWLDPPARVVVEQCDLGTELVRLVSRLGGDAKGGRDRDGERHGPRSRIRKTAAGAAR